MQKVLVFVFIAVALGYLAWRGWKTMSGKKQKGCEKCGPGEQLKS